MADDDDNNDDDKDKPYWETDWYKAIMTPEYVEWLIRHHNVPQYLVDDAKRRQQRSSYTINISVPDPGWTDDAWSTWSTLAPETARHERLDNGFFRTASFTFFTQKEADVFIHAFRQLEAQKLAEN